jgi:hypothetical protein
MAHGLLFLHCMCSCFVGREREGEREGEEEGMMEQPKMGEFEFGRFEFKCVLWRNFTCHTRIRQLGIFLSKSVQSLAILPSTGEIK